MNYSEYDLIYTINDTVESSINFINTLLKHDYKKNIILFTDICIGLESLYIIQNLQIVIPLINKNIQKYEWNLYIQNHLSLYKNVYYYNQFENIKSLSFSENNLIRLNIYDKIKKLNIKDEYVFEYIKNDVEYEIKNHHTVFTILNSSNKTGIVAANPNTKMSGIYCWVKNYLSAINYIKKNKYELIKFCYKDGWSLYKNENENRYFYEQIFKQDLLKEDLFERYFSNSDIINDTIEKLLLHYDINVENVIGVCYRGTDIIKECGKLPNVEQFIIKCENLILKNDNLKILIQTDEQPVLDLFINKFKDRCIFIKEIPISNDGKNVFHKILNNKIDICIYLVSTLIILSKCKFLITSHFGNTINILPKYRKINTGNLNNYIKIYP